MTGSPHPGQSVAFITLGCKINQYETQAIRREVLALGYREVRPTETADVYVVNTCAVTGTSGAKSRKAIQRAARTSPDSRIVVVGCSTPEEKASFAVIPQVALVAGHDEKTMVAPFLAGEWAPLSSADATTGAPSAPMRDIFALGVGEFAGRSRATIKVQDGCNSFCSFCIIPFLRGTSKSRPADDVVAEIARIIDGAAGAGRTGGGAGYREIVLSGVHLQDWGAELESPDGQPATLATLLDRIIEGLGSRARGAEGGAREDDVRLRLSSLGPRAFTQELLERLAHPVFCRHWHIPLQAGSDAVLDAMRRGYTVDEFRHAVGELRRRFDDPAITTDVIVGYPGETEAQFEATLGLCREVAFAKIHVFPFSLREGTLAAKTARAQCLDSREIRRRAQALGELDRELQAAYRSRFVGRTVDVLVEGASGDGLAAELVGTSDRYQRVRFPAPSPGAAARFPGTVRRVEVREVADDGLRGVWAETPAEPDEG